MKRTKIAYNDELGKKCIGYAWMDTDSELVWVFDSKDTQYGATIFKSQIVKVY